MIKPRQSSMYARVFLTRLSPISMLPSGASNRNGYRGVAIRASWWSNPPTSVVAITFAREARFKQRFISVRDPTRTQISQYIIQSSHGLLCISLSRWVWLQRQICVLTAAFFSLHARHYVPSTIIMLKRSFHTHTQFERVKLFLPKVPEASGTNEHLTHRLDSTGASQDYS